MKAIVFNASRKGLLLSVSKEELTDASVLKAVDTNLVEPLRGNVLRYLDKMKNPWGLR